MEIKSSDKFLYRVADDLLNRFGNDLQHVAIVFNNKRPQLFLRKYLAEIIGKPIWSPHLYTIQQFFSESTSLICASPLKQFFILYSEYNLLLKKEGKEALSADVFYPLAEIIVSDFSQIDYYMTDPKKVFNLIGSIAELEQQFPNFEKEQLEFMESFWSSFSQERQSKVQEKFIEMWHRMPELYLNFHKRLADNHLISSAKMYRNLAEGKDCNPRFLDQFSHVVFVGFNALSKAEEILFKSWQDKGKCSFYFDADEHYFANPIQEAGHFIRRNINIVGLENQFEQLENRIDVPEKEFTIIQALGKVAQGKLLTELLPDQSDKNDPSSKAIILADESLLLPVLQTLDDENLNITMGYPFEQSAVFGLCDLWLDIQEEIASGDQLTITFPKVLAFIFNPLLNTAEEERNAIHKEVIKEKKARFSLQNLRNSGKIAELSFSAFENPVQSVRHLGSLLLLVSEQIADIRKLESLLITEAVKTLNLLSDNLEELQNAQFIPEIKAGFVLKIIRRALAGLAVPFDGEPLSGLQVMGLLESRCLDFDELIVLGMNEGVLPKVSITPSFIPDNVRRAFGLPVLENQNSIFAYFFYRLLHCAKKVTLVYNGISDEKSSAEESRFIKQLEFETSCNFNHVLQQNQPLDTKTPQAIIVEKSGPVLDALQRFLIRNSESKYDKKISASAFTDYAACSLRFFFSKIAKLAEPKDLPDQIGPHTIGTMLHSVMEDFYRDSVGKEVITDYIRQREKLLPAMARQAMIKELGLSPSSDHPQSALQQIVIKVIEQYARKVIQHDVQIAPFVIKELEDRETCTPLLSIEVNGKEEKLRLMGIIDRVDIHQGKIRIVDYKTGRDKLKYNDFEALFEEEGKGQNKALLQTLFYTLVYEKARDVSGVEPHLYTVRDLKGDTQFSEKGIKGLLLNDDNLEDFKSRFEQRLKEKLTELFDQTIPFKQTSNLENCKYCSFKGICQR